jgi:hypothetical protein
LDHKEAKQRVDKKIFQNLKFEPYTGTKLGNYEIAFLANNETDGFKQAHNILTAAKATIKDRYHDERYQFSYWLYGEDKIYRQKLKKGEEPTRQQAVSS